MQSSRREYPQQLTSECAPLINLTPFNSRCAFQGWNLCFEEPANRHCIVLVTQSCPTLCDPMDCSLPGSSVSGILQARILEWVEISSSRGSSRLWSFVNKRLWRQIVGGRGFPSWCWCAYWWALLHDPHLLQCVNGQQRFLRHCHH